MTTASFAGVVVEPCWVALEGFELPDGVLDDATPQPENRDTINASARVIQILLFIARSFLTYLLIGSHKTLAVSDFD